MQQAARASRRHRVPDHGRGPRRATWSRWRRPSRSSRGRRTELTEDYITGGSDEPAGEPAHGPMSRASRRGSPESRPRATSSRHAGDASMRQLAPFKDNVLRLGALVERALERAGRALAERDAELADQVRWEDAEVNELQRRVNNEITVTLATQQPVARDVRELLALYHAAAELERMGDYATQHRQARPAARLRAGDPDLPPDPDHGAPLPLPAARGHARAGGRQRAGGARGVPPATTSSTRCTTRCTAAPWSSCSRSRAASRRRPT